MMLRTACRRALVETSARLIAPGLSMVMLAGCGGGGGGNSASEVLGPSAEAAMNAYLQVAHQSTLNATDSGGNKFTLQLSRIPTSTQTMFNGTSAYSMRDTFTLTKNRAPFAITYVDSFFVLNPYAPVGKDYSESNGPSGFYYQSSTLLRGVVTSSFPLPARWTVGDVGPG